MENQESSVERYQKITLPLKRIFESNCQRPLDATTIESWKVLAVSIRVVDDHIDSLRQPNQRKSFTTQAINFLMSNDDRADFGVDAVNSCLTSLKKRFDLLSDRNKETFLSNLRTIIQVTEQLKTAINPGEYATLTRIEGQATARLFLSFLPEEYKVNDQYRKCARMFKLMGRAGNLIDSIIDLSDDYRSGESVLPPTVKNRIILGANTIKDVCRVLIDGRTYLLKKIPRAIRWVAQDRQTS